jgi:cytochrome c2
MKNAWSERRSRVPVERTAFRRIRGGAVWIGIGLLAGFVFGVGCSDPDAAILASFDAEQEARFRRGRGVAVPCWTCHDLAGTVKKNGPALLGLYGRRSGLSPGYSASPALIGATIVWDDRTLAAFLSNPSGFIPGNRMVSPGIRDASALSDLLFYLQHVTRPGARESRVP